MKRHGEQRIAVEIEVIQMGYAEILRRVNLDTFNVRRAALVKNIFIKLKSAHVDKMICCLKKRLLKRIDSVTTLYRGLYTNIRCISIVFVSYFDELFVTYLICQSNSVELLIKVVCNYYARWRLTYMSRLRYTRKRLIYMNRHKYTRTRPTQMNRCRYTQTRLRSYM